MKIITRNSEQGIALIIVMVTIFVLAMLAGSFAYSMKVETKLARNAQNEAELEWLGRSGVEMARYILAQQMAIPSEPYDSLNQKWAGGPGGFGTFVRVVSIPFRLQNLNREKQAQVNKAPEIKDMGQVDDPLEEVVVMLKYG